MEIKHHPQHSQHNPKHHHLHWPISRQSSLRLYGGRQANINCRRLRTIRQLYRTIVRTAELVWYLLSYDTKEFRRYGEHVRFVA